jgi:hypothetical protein
LSYYVLGHKPGGGATGNIKRAGHRPDFKFDDYTQNSSEKQYKISKIKYRIKYRNDIRILMQNLIKFDKILFVNKFLAKLQKQRKIVSRFAKFTLPHYHPHEKNHYKR